MQKRIGMFAFFALAVLVFLIWTDPTGTANVMHRFFDSVLSFGKELGHRASEFFKGLGWT